MRWVGDYVAFVVAETLAQAADAAELIEVDYEPLPAIVSTADAVEPGAPLRLGRLPGQYLLSSISRATRRRPTPPSPTPTMSSSTASSSTASPRRRWSRAAAIGDYNPAEDRYTIYTTLQRTHGYRAELAQQVLKVPESKVRVVAGDIGGSFGMKSAIYNEVALVLLASKLTGRPVKWTSTRSEAFLGDAQARDNVTEAELALDNDGHFLGLRVKTIAAVGAYPQAGSNAFVANLGTLAGVYRTPAVHADVTAVFTNTNPVRPYRGNGRPEAAYVIERMVDLAADELGIDPVELRRRNMIPPEAMPFKIGPDLHLRLRRVREEPRHGAEARRCRRVRAAPRRVAGSAASCAASASPTRSSAPRRGGFEGAEIRFDRSGTVTLLSGSITQGQGHETVYKQLVCDRLGIHPDQVHYVQGDTDKVAIGEGTGGSRSAALGGSAVHLATEKIVAKAKAIAAHMLGADAGRRQFRRRPVLRAALQPHADHRRGRDGVARTRRTCPTDMEPGLIAERDLSAAKEQNFPNGCHICELEIDPETGDGRDRCATASSTMSAR